MPAYQRRAEVWTNLAYALAGLYGFFLGGPLAAPFLAACLFLAYGSWRYHEHRGLATEEPHRVLDRVGMYLVFSALTLLALGLTSPLVLLPVWAVLYAARHWWHSFYVLASMGAVVVASMLVGGLVVEASHACILFALAFTCWIAQERGTFRLGHAAWHLLTAALIGYLYAVLS